MRSFNDLYSKIRIFTLQTQKELLPVQHILISDLHFVEIIQLILTEIRRKVVEGLFLRKNETLGSRIFHETPQKHQQQQFLFYHLYELLNFFNNFYDKKHEQPQLQRQETGVSPRRHYE